MIDYEVLHNDVVSVLRPKGDPVGYKLFAERVEGLPYFKGTFALCQVIKQVAILGKVLAVNVDNVDACVIGTYVLGFKELPEDFIERWVVERKMNESVVKQLVAGIHAFEMGRYKSALFAPLRHYKTLNIDPDGVVLVVNSTQAYIVLAGFFDSTGIKPLSDFNGHAACELVVPPLKGRSPWLTVPCGGARALAEAQDDELWIGIKPEDLRKTVDRLKAVGMKYPLTAYQMLVTQPNPAHPLTHLISRKRVTG
ncbi:MAG: DUF169 domain-containing protein [Desulfurococcaceae archaeon]